MSDRTELTLAERPVVPLIRIYQDLHRFAPMHERVPDFIVLLSTLDPQLQGLADSTDQISNSFSEWTQRYEADSTKKDFPWDEYSIAMAQHGDNVRFTTVVAIPYIHQLIEQGLTDEFVPALYNLLRVGKNVYPGSIMPYPGFDKEAYFQLVGRMLCDSDIRAKCDQIQLALAVLTAIDQSEDSVLHLGLIPEEVATSQAQLIAAEMTTQESLVFFQAAYSPSLVAPIPHEVSKNLVSFTSAFVESSPLHTYQICTNLIRSALRAIDLDNQSPEYVEQVRKGALLQMAKLVLDTNIEVPEEQEIPDALVLLSFLQINKDIFWQFPELEALVEKLFLTTQPEVARKRRVDQVWMLYDLVWDLIPEPRRIIIMNAIDNQEYELALNEMAHYSGNKTIAVDDERKQILKEVSRAIKATSAKYAIK